MTPSVSHILPAFILARKLNTNTLFPLHNTGGVEQSCDTRTRVNVFVLVYLYLKKNLTTKC